MKLTCNWLFISPVFCIASITVMHYCSLVVGSLSSVHVCNRCMALLLCVWSQNTYHEYSRPGGRTTAANNQTVLCISRNAAHTSVRFMIVSAWAVGFYVTAHTHTYIHWVGHVTTHVVLAKYSVQTSWLVVRHRVWSAATASCSALSTKLRFAFQHHCNYTSGLLYDVYIYIYIYIYICVCVDPPALSEVHRAIRRQSCRRCLSPSRAVEARRNATNSSPRPVVLAHLEWRGSFTRF